jgi:hypothetical protein
MHTIGFWGFGCMVFVDQMGQDEMHYACRLVRRACGTVASPFIA